MGLIRAPLSVIAKVNDLLLLLGRQLAVLCVALMVASILAQVFFRYVLNNALPWPEEVARALMIWMVGFTAPTAYRYGGFVAIDMLRDALPVALRRLLTFVLLILATLVLFKLAELALAFYERGFRTRAATFDLPRAYIYLAMPVCFIGMLLVNVELLLREIGRAVAGDAAFPDPPHWTGGVAAPAGDA